MMMRTLDARVAQLGECTAAEAVGAYPFKINTQGKSTNQTSTSARPSVESHRPFGHTLLVN